MSRTLVALVGVKLALHLATIGLYGLHRDELYLLAGGERLAFGSIDHAPITSAISRAASELFGDSPAGQRLPACLAGAAVVWLTALLARRLGGGRGAMLLAGGAMLVAPAFLWASGVQGTNVYDQLAWVAATYLLVVLQARPRATVLWLALGAVVGLGWLNKYTIGVWAAGALAALLLGPGRDVLRTRGPWLALAVGALLALPNLLWQAEHGFPAIDFLRESRAAVSRATFLLEQPALAHPLGFALAVLGLFAGLRRRATPELRLGAVLFFSALTVFLVLVAKPYYLAPAYPPLFAAGAVLVARRLEGRKRAAALLAGLFVAGGALAFLGTLPVLPGEVLFGRLGLERVNRNLTQFPEWRGLVAQLGDARPADASAIPVLTRSYGMAAAVERYGAAHGLGPVLSGANSYFAWSEPALEPERVLAHEYAPSLLAELFREVVPVGTVTSPFGLDNRFDYPRTIYLCRGRVASLREAWRRFRSFD